MEMENLNIFELLSSDNVSLGEDDMKVEIDELITPFMEPSNDMSMDEPIDFMKDLTSTNLELENSYDYDALKDVFNFDEFDINESGSDSGLSNTADNIIMSSPSSGVISPDPRGDVSVDTLDAVSDVSSTSDLGSAYSFSTSPVRSSNHGASLGLDSLSDDIIDIKYSPPQNVLYSPEPTIITTKNINMKNISLSSGPVVTQGFTLAANRQTISNVKILDSSSNVPKIVSIKHCGNGKFPILKRLHLNPLKQAVVVPKTNTVQLTGIKNKTILKTTNVNGKSTLLPLKVHEFINMHNMQNVKNITVYNHVNKVDSPRIVSVVDKSQLLNSKNLFCSKVTNGRTHLKVSPANIESRKISPAFTIKEEEESSSSDEETPQQGQRLILSEEEKRLMNKEGITLPARYPLTKHEERDLKKIRRKIRNKKSAQDSRKRKKEYVDNLEDRVKLCSDENQQLQKKISSLEKQNENLSVQLKRFQNLIGHNINSRSHNHASTALMMLILSAALIVVPSLRPQEGKGENELTSNAKMPNSGHSRTLLETGSASLTFNNNRNTNNQNLELFEDEEIIETDSFSSGALSDHDYEPSSKRMRSDPLFVSSSMGNRFSKGDPPDVAPKGVYALLGAMLHRLGTNWTDPGGSNNWAGTTTSSSSSVPQINGSHSQPESSVVVNLNRTLLDDIEVE